jgi:CPA2 family monovalent cation:H+ antiporter-2
VPLEHILTDLAAVFALCVAAGVVFQRLKMPPIVGFLVIGAVLGPNSIGLVGEEATVSSLAEVGVVVLLFAVGMELPLSQLARLRRTILIGGGLQIAGTVLLAAVICALFGMGWNQALFLGFLLSLSSTAALTKVLVDHGEFSTPHGRFAMGIAIAQDLAVVPMILLIPMLVGEASGKPSGGALATLENLALLAIVLAVAHFVLPKVLELVSRTRSRELFVLTLAALCLAMAVVTARLGMSMALGAFLAGILLADTDFHGHAMAEVEPFRDALASLFFVSIGMLFDPAVIVDSPWSVLGALVMVIAGKAAIVAFAARVLGQPGWVGVRSGLLLAQVGEFSFVLAQVGGGTDVLPERTYKIFLVVAVLSIASTPLMHQFGRWLVTRHRGRESGVTKVTDTLKDHAIVIGYGPTGRTVVQALTALGLRVVALELNATTVRQERARGVPIEAGDATRASVLKKIGIERARILVLAVNDSVAAQRIAQVATLIAPQVHVLARAVYIGEIEGLQQAGADEVVPQELEASVEILVRVLRRFLVADDEIGRRVADVRTAAGGLSKNAPIARLEAARIAEFLPGLGIGVHRVAAFAFVVGRTLAELAIRKTTGCTIVAVRRGIDNLPAITPETVLQVGDAVVVIGPQTRLADVAAMFASPGSMRDDAPLPQVANATGENGAARR